VADKVDITLDINAVKVIQVLNEVNQLADTASGKAQLLKKHLLDLSRATGTAPEKLLKDLQALQGQVIKGSSETFGGFKTGTFKVDVTDDVFQETTALLEADKALNKYASADAKAAAANKNFDGSVKQVNASIGEQKAKLQVLAAEMNKLKFPAQGRNPLTGQFSQKGGFEQQFNSATTYQDKLKLVEATISQLRQKTNLPFKDVGKELGNSFPELLKDTNLVSTAVENLSRSNAGLSSSFRSVKQIATEVDLALTKLQSAGKINLKGTPQQISTNLQGTIKDVATQTGANYEQVATGLTRMGVPAAQVKEALAMVNKEMMSPAAAQYAQKLAVLKGELATLGNATLGNQNFANQFKGLSTYQQQLKLVETTISDLQKKTNLPFKDIGKELGKSFPELLKDTNLVSNAVSNLTRQNQGLSASFKAEAQSIRLVQAELTRLQAAGKINLTGSPQQILNNLKETIKAVSGSTGAQYEQVGKQLQAMGAPAELARRAVKGLNEELVHGVKNSKHFQHGIDVIRTALGTLVAVGIFTFLNAIQKGFTEATKAARELEDSLFRLTNVERILSQGGTDVTMKGLKDGIQEIKKLFPIFSQEDLTQLVAQISISTKELGLTERQIIDLSKAIAVLNIRSTEEETASQTAQKVISSLITDNAKGIASLGLSFNENTMEIKGMELGIITATHKLKDLTNEEKAQIKYNILLENTGGELSNVNDYLDTNTAKIKANSAAWHDFLTTVGQGINNLIPDIVPLVEKLQKSSELSGLDQLIRGTGKTNIGIGSDPQLLAVQAKMFLGLKLTTKEYEHLKEVLESIPDDEILKIFPDPSAIKDRFTRELVESIVEIKDTATGLPDPLIDASVDDSGLDELSEKLQDIAIDAQHAREDLAVLLEQKQEDLEINFQLKLDDLDTEYIQKAEDAAIDYGHKVEDINLDAQQKIEDAKRKAREDEEKAEAEFLLRMKHLRMDFLLDLDDALHARDARQVLRLIKEYNNDKQKLVDKKALDDKFRQESLEADLKNIEVERQRKLESAAVEYQRKLEQLAVAKQRELAELALWKQREEAELATWYQRELEEIDRNTQQKIERLLAGYIEEGKIHEEQQAKIHGILLKWFGQNKGLVDNLMAYTASAFANMAAMAASALSFASMPLPASMSGAPAPYWQMAAQSAGGLASGGQFVATKPTSALFGEGGEPELVTVTPLSKLASLRGKQPINGADGMDGRNGQQRIVLDMNLSPDLEARVIERAMDGTADVISKINRSKG
jgi:hypothetical protein